MGLDVPCPDVAHVESVEVKSIESMIPQVIFRQSYPHFPLPVKFYGKEVNFYFDLCKDASGGCAPCRPLEHQAESQIGPSGGTPYSRTNDPSLISVRRYEAQF